MARKVLVVLAAMLVGGSVGSAVGTASAAAPLIFHRPIVSLGANQSSNWSGYNQGTLEQGGGVMFNAVSASWRVPTATAHAPNEAEYSSTWVGIGGGCVDAACTLTDSTLIQAGTEQDVDKTGAASYSAWYEIIPEPSTPISMTVHARDKMFVSVAESSPGSEMWTFTIKNLTTGATFTLPQPYSSTHATVEWIVETPVVIDSGGNVTVGPLPNLSKVKINKALVNGANPHLAASEEVQLVDVNTSAVLATPSAPDPDTDGFADCTFATTCPAPKKS